MDHRPLPVGFEFFAEHLRKRRLGVLMDYLFLNPDDSEHKVILPPPAPGYFVNSEIDLTILELGGFFRQDEDAE